MVLLKQEEMASDSGKIPYGASEGSLKRKRSSASLDARAEGNASFAEQEQFDMLNNAAELLLHREATISNRARMSSYAAASYDSKGPLATESSSARSQESYYFLPRHNAKDSNVVATTHIQQFPMNATMSSLTWPPSSSSSGPPSSDPSITGSSATTSTDNISTSCSCIFTTTAIREFDILFGRGKTHRRHPGNRRMQLVADLYRDIYISSDREEKTSITKSIVQMLKSGTKSGRFLKMHPVLGQWVEVSDEVARAKVGHAIRDGRSTTILEHWDLEILQDFPTLPEPIKQAIVCQARPTSNIKKKKNPAYHAFGKEEAAMIIEVFANSPPRQHQEKE